MSVFCDCGNFGDIIGVVGIVVMITMLVGLIVWEVRARGR